MLNKFMLAVLAMCLVTSAALAENITGTSSAANVSTFVTRDGSGDIFGATIHASGQFNGSGAGLTVVPASALTGALPAGTTAAAGTLTGTTLASNVVTSSLTSVGVLTGLTISGNIALTSGTPTITLGTAGTNAVLTIQDAEATPHTLVTITDNGSSATVTAASFVGALTGNASTATSATTAGSATNFTGSLVGDVTGTQGATVVSHVADTALSSNVALLGATQTFTAANVIAPTGSNVIGLTVRRSATNTGADVFDVTNNGTGIFFSVANDGSVNVTNGLTAGIYHGDGSSLSNVLITTGGTQSIAGAKTFSNDLTLSAKLFDGQATPSAGTSGQVLSSTGSKVQWISLGTLSTQNASGVAITGGTIDGTVIGGTSAVAGTFTTVTATSFSGAGTGLTGTAASLSIGGTAATATAVNFSGVAAGTNAAALVVSGSLGTTGGGTIAATSVPASGITGTISGTAISGGTFGTVNGSNLTNLTGANVTGTVASASNSSTLNGKADTAFAQVGTANTFTTGLQLIHTGSTGNVGLQVDATASPTVDIVDFSIAGTVVSAIDKTGSFTGNAATATSFTESVLNGDVTGTQGATTVVSVQSAAGGSIAAALTASGGTLTNNTSGTAANVTGIVALVHGGTGVAAASANEAFNALSPMTTLGDIIYGGTAGAGTRLAGNATVTKNFLTQTGNGTVSAAPVWGTIANTDVSGLGTMSTQSAGAVAITGGAIDGTAIGGGTAATGKFTALTATSSITLPAASIADSALSANVALRNTDNNFSSSQTVTGTVTASRLVVPIVNETVADGAGANGDNPTDVSSTSSINLTDTAAPTTAPFIVTLMGVSNGQIIIVKNNASFAATIEVGDGTGTTVNLAVGDRFILYVTGTNSIEKL